MSSAALLHVERAILTRAGAGGRRHASRAISATVRERLDLTVRMSPSGPRWRGPVIASLSGMVVVMPFAAPVARAAAK